MTAPLILWIRRDLRLDDNPLLSAAAATGRPVIPVFIADDSVTGIGAAARWRLGEGVAAFAARLRAAGSDLILRRGAALPVLSELADQTGAAGVWWSRLYDPQARTRDGSVKTALRQRGLDARSFPGHLLCEPWQVQTGAGGVYRVYTPFWRAISRMELPAPEPAPARLAAPDVWPRSEDLSTWRLGAALNRGAPVLARHADIGETAALDRLARFMAGPVADYAANRDQMGIAGTSGLSEALTLGEIGVRRVWAAARGPQAPGTGAESFARELVWREFAHHLMYHTPHLLTENWRADWADFPWRGESDIAERWRRAQTGEPLVDAGLREMYVTGRMHNRARMIVASYLTKHLLTHWKIGLDWFADCLTDWDPAANAMGWQWVAGSGPDAAPYFRVFNPQTQAEKFDRTGAYRRRFIAEGQPAPGPEARAWFEAVPRSWGLSPDAPYRPRMIDLAQGRARALAAYAGRAGRVDGP